MNTNELLSWRKLPLSLCLFTGTICMWIRQNLKGTVQRSDLHWKNKTYQLKRPVKSIPGLVGAQPSCALVLYYCEVITIGEMWWFTYLTITYRKCLEKCVNFSAGSRPWDKGRGGLQKKFFRPLGPAASVWSKNKVGPRPLAPLPWIRHWICCQTLRQFRFNGCPCFRLLDVCFPLDLCIFSLVVIVQRIVLANW